MALLKPLHLINLTLDKGPKLLGKNAADLNRRKYDLPYKQNSFE